MQLLFLEDSYDKFDLIISSEQNENSLMPEVTVCKKLDQEVKNSLALDSNMIEMVNFALLPGRSTDVLVTGFGLCIIRSDILTLSELNWLNDQIINFYMNLLI